MEYDCQIVLANKIQAGFNKVAKPLCTNCTNRGCTNPIVSKKISIFGKIMSTRLYDSGYGHFMVVSCDGYQPAELREEDEEDEEDGDAL